MSRATACRLWPQAASPVLFSHFFRELGIMCSPSSCDSGHSNFFQTSASLLGNHWDSNSHLTGWYQMTKNHKCDWCYIFKFWMDFFSFSFLSFFLSSLQEGRIFLALPYLPSAWHYTRFLSWEWIFQILPLFSYLSPSLSSPSFKISQRKRWGLSGAVGIAPVGMLLDACSPAGKGLKTLW